MKDNNFIKSNYKIAREILSQYSYEIDYSYIDLVVDDFLEYIKEEYNIINSILNLDLKTIKQKEKVIEEYKEEFFIYAMILYNVKKDNYYNKLFHKLVKKKYLGNEENLLVNDLKKIKNINSIEYIIDRIRDLNLQKIKKLKIDNKLFGFLNKSAKFKTLSSFLSGSGIKMNSVKKEHLGFYNKSALSYNFSINNYFIFICTVENVVLRKKIKYGENIQEIRIKKVLDKIK